MSAEKPNPEIDLRLPLGSVNFILKSIDLNPLHEPVTRVHALMQLIMDFTRKSLQREAGVVQEEEKAGGTD